MHYEINSKKFNLKEERKVLLKILQIVFSIIAFSLSAYGLITQDYQLNYLMILFLGLFMLTLGIKEFQRERKVYGWFLIGLFLFSVFVSIQSFMYTPS
ncbi:YczI family protein [Lysinibacillus sp. NPDC056232]|uniref:YczI family protein n=1 Tax=Lysinibacillus sp. NPDC056232 TaxID=3345756 RepID=UPI0035D9676E